MAEKKEKKKVEAKKKNFFQELFAELKRVAWPDRNKLLHSTAAVFVIAIAFALLIWIVDSLVYGGLNWLGFHEKRELPHQVNPHPPVSETGTPVPLQSEAGK